jgi:nucleotide-binding universal stress UspA family protein
VGGSVVILWATTSTTGFDVVEAYARGASAELARSPIRDLPSRALVASSYASVIAVVEDDRAATEALGAGVDEIVRRSDATVEALERAVSRAEARARGRLHAIASPRPADDASSFASLLDWIAIELVACVSGAVLESELLEDGVRRLVGAPQPRALGSRSEDILEMLETIKESQRRTKEVLQAIRSLAGADAVNTSVPDVLHALARILRGRSVPLMDLTLEIEGPCVTSVPVPKLVATLVGLISGALDRATRSRRADRVTLILRAFVAEEATIVEIEDDASDESVEGPHRHADGMAAIRAAMREHGADMVVETALGRTTARLVLPPVEDSLATTPDAARPHVANNRAN